MKRIRQGFSVAMLGLGFLGAVAGQSVVAADDPSVYLVRGDLTCESAVGAFGYENVPDTHSIVVSLYNWEDGVFNYTVYDIPDGSTDGVVDFELDFPSQRPSDWTVEIYTVDESDTFDTLYYEEVGISRDCMVGYASPGGTGSDDDAAMPIDARSDATTEVEEDEPVEDPDGDGRVQVP